MSRLTAVAAMVLVAGLGLSACGSAKGPASIASPEKSTSSSPEAAAQIESLDKHCPSPNAPISYPPDGNLSPKGLVGVRMCNGEEKFKDAAQFDVVPPSDELTTGIDQLIQVVNEGDPATANKCFSDEGPDLVFWFRYKDGTSRAVVDQRYGCRPLVVGTDQLRSAGDALYTSFIHALTAQRAALPSPTVATPAPSCDPDQPLTPSDLSQGIELRSAALCLDQGGGQVTEAIFKPEEVTQLNKDYAAKHDAGGGGACVPGKKRWIVGATAWGDHVLLLGDPTSCSFKIPNVVPQQLGYYWTPSAKAEQMLGQVATQK